MSGSSSAFLDGYLSGRQRGRKKDLDLSELINICAKPESIDDRVAALQHYGNMYPEFRYFMIVAYFCKNEFSQLRALGVLDYAPSRVPKGGSVESLKSMWTQVTRMYDEFPTSARAKRGIAQQLLSSLHLDDAKLIHQLLAGKFYMKELNELVVSKAFPKETPRDPKA